MGSTDPGTVEELRRLADMLAGGLGDRVRGAQGSPEQVQATVAADLYGDWYLGPAPGQGAPTPAVVTDRPDLRRVLRAAHAGSLRFERGWVVLTALAHGSLVIAREDQQRVVESGDFVCVARPGVPPAPGEEVAVARRVMAEESGWWATSSQHGDPQGMLGRHYLHPTAEGVATAVNLLTAELLDAPFAWSLKCPIASEGYRRPDSLVVYAARQHTQDVRTHLLEVAALIDPLLLVHLPPLTHRVSPQVAYADDPGPQQSYGSLICGALAPGALALTAGTGSVADPVAVLVESLATAGLDPQRPWEEAVPA
jgi:hypothetical protein